MKHKRTEYNTLDTSNISHTDRNFEMAPVKSIRTYVHTGDRREVEEDGIHLQYNVEQETVSRI
jgi:hypothetical protein